MLALVGILVNLVGIIEMLVGKGYFPTKKRPILFEWSLVLPYLSYPFSKFTYLKTCLIVRHSYDLILIG